MRSTLRHTTARRGERRVRRLPAYGLALLALWLIPATSRADIFHLRSGGTIEGQLLSQDSEQYKIRSSVGIVLLPRNEVERVEAAPTAFEEYEQRRAAAGNTADDQAALGQWCEDQGLSTEARRHYEAALELDANHAAARRALGYIRVNGLWVNGRSLATTQPSHKDNADESKAPDTTQPSDREQLKRAIQGQWRRRIRAIRHSLLESSLERLQKNGRDQVERIRDPLAILPLTQELSAGEVETRLLLIEMLGRFDDDEATMNLAVIGLVDPSEAVRQAAVVELKRRNDPRVVAQYRQALRSDSDAVLRRAAYGLGQFGSASATDDLIEALTVHRSAYVEVSARTYLATMPRAFAVTRMGGGADVSGFTRYPEIGVANCFEDLENSWQLLPVTVMRTEVLEALKKITGQNFGFDRDKWRAWLREAES